MWQWRKWQQEHTEKSISINTNLVSQENNQNIKNIIQKAITNNQSSLDNFESNEILKFLGIPTPPTQMVNSLDEAKKFVQENNYPVVLKLSATGLLHKADVGGVINNITNDQELETGFASLDNAAAKISPTFQGKISKQIQKSVTSKAKVNIGIKKDPSFGNVLLFGAGGSLAELIIDRNLCLLPIDLVETKKLVEKSKIYKVLRGYRGKNPLALDKLYDVIIRLGLISEISPEIMEMEINPLIIDENNIWAVDGKVVLK
jgi:acyl-CoA synthetase (NDP forming)